MPFKPSHHQFVIKAFYYTRIVSKLLGSSLWKNCLSDVNLRDFSFFSFFLFLLRLVLYSIRVHTQHSGHHSLYDQYKSYRIETYCNFPRRCRQDSRWSRCSGSVRWCNGRHWRRRRMRGHIWTWPWLRTDGGFGGGGRKKSIGEAEWMQQISMHYIMFYDRISLGCDAQGKGGTRQQGRILFLEVFMVITQWARFYVLKLKQRAIQQLTIVQDLKRQKSCFVIEAN